MVISGDGVLKHRITCSYAPFCHVPAGGPGLWPSAWWLWVGLGKPSDELEVEIRQEDMWNNKELFGPPAEAK